METDAVRRPFTPEITAKNDGMRLQPIARNDKLRSEGLKKGLDQLLEHGKII